MKRLKLRMPPGPRTQAAMEKFARAVAKLQPVPAQKRIGRRNARRAVIGAMRSVREAMDLEYPRIGKPKPAADVKAVVVAKAKAGRLKLPFHRAWDIATARLFVGLAANVVGVPIPRVLAHEGSLFETFYGDRSLYFNPTWSARKKWLQTIAHFRHHFKAGDTALKVWTDFWTTQIPVTDLQLAADHHAFLEKREGRADCGSRAGRARVAAEHDKFLEEYNRGRVPQKDCHA